MVLASFCSLAPASLIGAVASPGLAVELVEGAARVWVSGGLALGRLDRLGSDERGGGADRLTRPRQSAANDGGSQTQTHGGGDHGSNDNGAGGLGHIELH